MVYQSNTQNLILCALDTVLLSCYAITFAIACKRTWKLDNGMPQYLNEIGVFIFCEDRHLHLTGKTSKPLHVQITNTIYSYVARIPLCINDLQDW